MYTQKMEENSTPFWVQNNRAKLDRHHRPKASSLFLNTGVLVLGLLSAAVLFLIIVIPSVLSVARQVFNPSLVKSSWNLVNIVLVLFAILCGLFGKRTEDQTPTNTPLKRETDNVNSVSQSSPRQWYDFQDDSRVKILRRNSTSYPDLRQASWVDKENIWTSYDDHYYQFQRSDSSLSRIQEVLTPRIQPALSPQLLSPPAVAAEAVDGDESGDKVIEIDTEVVSVSSDLSLVLSPLVSDPPAPPPPPSPPRLVESRKHREEKNERSQKRRGGVSVTKDFLTSFYHQRKRKKQQKRKSYDNLDEFIEPPKVSIHRSKSNPELFPPLSTPQPPPPPPPPPPTRFQNLYPYRKNKIKKQVPPPRRLIATINGNESPRIIIPPPLPPPPPPPYKMPSWKFMRQGDYMNSPASGYSASEEDDGSPSISRTSSTIASSSPFCPSPDVNLKADDFIANFRAKLTLEKMNSINRKDEIGLSPLGPDFSQS